MIATEVIRRVQERMHQEHPHIPVVTTETGLDTDEQYVPILTRVLQEEFEAAYGPSALIKCVRP